MEEKKVIYEKKPPIAFVTLNRPEIRNALDFEPDGAIEQLTEIWKDVRYDPEIRVAVLKGAGPCFCAGFDMSMTGTERAAPSKLDPLGLTKGHETDPWALYTGKDNPEAGPNIGGGMPVTEAMWNCTKPIIAQVHSYCLGGGLWLANYCDIVIASADALFGYPPIRFSNPITLPVLMPWLLGMRKTNEMAFTGAMIDSQEAYTCGLINKVVPGDKLDEQVLKMAEVIAAIPPMNNLYSKLIIHNFYEAMGIKSAMEYSLALGFMIEGSSIPGGLRGDLQKGEEMGVSKSLKEIMAPYTEYDKEIRERARKLAENIE